MTVRVCYGDGVRDPVADPTTELQLVTLDADHPGFRDRAYRARRDEIARLALHHRDDQPAPTVPYSDEEHAVWRLILERLAPLHEARAVRAIHEANALVPLPRDRIPQLEEVNALLARHGGARMLPAAGLVLARDFLAALGRGIFRSTQYIRHHSRPFYTPEPDVVHELVGHAATLAHPDFARMNALFGRAIEGADEALELALIRLYWWTVEFGVVEEDGRLKTLGAGLLSSVGELGSFEDNASLVPFSIERAIATPFDPTAYQGTLFVAPSYRAMVDATCDWIERQPTVQRTPPRVPA